MSASRVRTVVWCSDEQLDFVARVAACQLIELIGVCAVDGARTTHAALALGTNPIDDPRQLATIECDAIWLAADSAMAPETLVLVGARGCAIATAPQPATLPEFAEAQREAARLRSASGTALPRPTPLLADSIVDGDGGDLLRHFGRIDGIVAAIGASAALGGIGARVLDVADLALRSLGQPDTVLATFVPASGVASMGENLRGLEGTLSLLIRTESSSVAATISTHAGTARRITLFGPAGRIEIDGSSMRWLDVAGASVDELRPRRVRKRTNPSGRSGPIDETTLVADAVAESLRATGGKRSPAVIDLPAALAICEAARLSCRTRAPESPLLLRQTLAASQRA